MFRIFRSGSVETVALRGATMHVDPGEFVALVGPSGCGKSTLLQIAAGLEEPSAGSVEVAGQRLSDLGEGARTVLRRQRLGIVYQRDNLFNHLTARENVVLAARLAGAPDPLGRAARLLGELGVEARAESRPGALSGGEQQRVAIAVAVAGEPSLLLADEPTGELDRANEQLVLAQLEGARGRLQCAVLVVTHSDVVANRADRVVHMEDGTCH